MVAVMDTGANSSELFYQNKCDSSDFECSNCSVLEKQLHNALVDLDSANLIIKLLQKEVDTNSSLDIKTSDVSTSPRSTVIKWTIA
jgi:hypothetical protein